VIADLVLAAASEPVNPVRGGGVLLGVIVVGIGFCWLLGKIWKGPGSW
jgi:hypothetical protein